MCPSLPETSPFLSPHIPRVPLVLDKRCHTLFGEFSVSQRRRKGEVMYNYSSRNHQYFPNSISQPKQPYIPKLLAGCVPGAVFRPSVFILNAFPGPNLVSCYPMALVSKLVFTDSQKSGADSLIGSICIYNLFLSRLIYNSFTLG